MHQLEPMRLFTSEDVYHVFSVIMVLIKTIFIWRWVWCRCCSADCVHTLVRPFEWLWVWDQTYELSETAIQKIQHRL